MLVTLGAYMYLGLNVHPVFKIGKLHAHCNPAL